MTPFDRKAANWGLPPFSPYHRAMLNPLDLYDLRGLLTDDERMIQDSVGRFVDEKVLPIIQECFEKHHFPKEIIPEIAELGLLGSSIQGYDCAGLNAVSYGLICQELERGDSGIRSFVSVQSSLCMYPIYAFGSEEQKQRWLPDMARGRKIGCFGLTEPHGGSDPANMKTRAVKERRRLGHQRRQDVDHQRRHRRPVHLLGDDRRRHPRFHHREGHEGLFGAGDRTQVQPARLGDLGTVLRQRGGAGSQPAAGA